MSDKGNGYFLIDNGFTFHRLSFISNAKMLNAELVEIKQKLFSNPYGYCADGDETYQHAMLKVNKLILAENLKKTDVSRTSLESTELRTKVWLMEDGSLSVDKERFSLMSGKGQNLLVLILRAVQQSSQPKTASLASQQTYPSIRYSVPEAFDVSVNLSEGQDQSTGCVMKMVKGTGNAWTIENKKELNGKGFTDEVLEELVRTSPDLQHTNKKKMKLDINNKPLIVSFSINWPSNRKAEEADDFFADNLQIPTYSLSKYNGLLNALNAVSTALDFLSPQ